MAFAAKSIWDFRTTGSDANGGGFDPSNANFAADLTTDTNTGNTASPVVSSASYNFAAGDVGAWLFIKSGTNWTPGWYQIASVAANKATLTASIGSGYLMANSLPVGVTTAAGVATVGTPTGGTWGIDYSQSDSARLSYTDMVIDGTTNTRYTSAGNPVGVNVVGNVVNVTSGTGFTVQRVQVVSVSGTTATCDKSLGTLSSTGGNGSLGGCLATPGQVGGLKIAGNSVFGKNGTYSLTGNTVNTAGCQVSDTTGGVDQTNVSWWVGWSSARHINTADTSWPTVNANAQTSLTLMSFTGQYTRARNWVVDGNARTALTGLNQNNNYQRLDNIRAQNCTAIGIDVQGGNNVSANRIAATACSGTAAIRVGNANVTVVYYAEAYANTTHGFVAGNGVRLINCISSGNTGGSTDGFSSSSIGYDAINCVAYGNGRAGFDAGSSIGNQFFCNCIAEDNGGAGWSSSSVRQLVSLLNCAGRNNTSGNYSTTNVNNVIGFVTLTASAFTNPGSGDFSLNNTAGGGAACRAAGFPGVMPRGTTTGYADIGAVQHQDAGGSSLVFQITGARSIGTY